MSDTSRSPNHLAKETSPYLLQHAYNPVDWHPWGEEALHLAREQDKPIFLSVGYSSCHWCHVMERESFENTDIAREMNEHCINIKVDREERPDIDAIYMAAVQMLTGQGGWPMSVFLTPDLRPFFGGTYFPPDRRHGRPGFGEVVRAIAGTYRSEPGKVESTASLLAERLAAPEDHGSTELPGAETLRSAVEDAARRFDPAHGGFGPAPKFPRSVEISMLLRAQARAADGRILDMCERTLEGMAYGGMYDQIGGGFHRYSVDAKWLVPHFEKMLYDNALLARTYLEALQLTGRELYERVSREILDYVLREMTSPEGGFYCATDADSEGVEGAFFVWTPSEVEELVGAEDARLVCEYYNITEAGNFEGATSIPNITRALDVVAESLGVDLADARDRLGVARSKLHAAREQRERPFRDEKILTSWNGLMISALARGAQVLDESRYADAARKSADLILASLRDGEGRLLRVRKDRESRIGAFLDDHAYLIEGLLDLWESSFEPRYLDAARQLCDRVLEDFWDDELGGLFFTSTSHECVIARRKDSFDNATPSPTGVMALNLLRLERLSGESSYREKAEAVLRSVSTAVDRMPVGFSSTLIALDFLLGPPVEIALVGDLDDESARRFLREIHRGFLGARVIAAGGSPVPEDLAARVPLLRGREAVDGRATAFICRNFACGTPLTDPAEIAAALPFADFRKG